MIFHKPLYLFWYARLGSNQRLSAPEADALSTELRARIDVFNEKQYIVSGGKSTSIEVKLDGVGKGQIHN